MNWINTSPIQEMINFISQKDVTILRVLAHSALLVSIRNAHQKFVKYVNDRGNMAIIMDIVLTPKFRKLADFKKISQGAIQVLTSQSTNFMNPIIANPVFKEKILNFMSSSELKNPIISGNFSMILESTVRFSHGNLLQEIPHIKEWFLTNCHTFAIRDLFSHFLIDYPNFFDMTTSYATKIARSAALPTGYNLISAVLIFLNSKTEFIKSFKAKSVVEPLMNATLYPDSSPAKLISLFTLMQKIIEAGYVIPDIYVEKESKAFLNREKPIPDSVLIAALPVLKTTSKNILGKILLPESGSRLKQSILMVFQKFTDTELAAISTELDLPKRLIDCVPKQKMNVQILFLAQLLQRINIQVKGWTAFSNTVNKRIEALDQAYGGKRKDSTLDLDNVSENAETSSSSDDDVAIDDDDSLEDGLPPGFGESDPGHPTLIQPMENLSFGIFRA